MYQAYAALKIARESGVLTVTLDNPPTNAVNAAMHGELKTLFALINQDEETKVVVLTGAGERAFSAGGDGVTLFLVPANARGVRVTLTRSSMVHGRRSSILTQSRSHPTPSSARLTAGSISSSGQLTKASPLSARRRSASWTGFWERQLNT